MNRGDPSADSVGVRVGPYRLIGTLGEGGMGVVHLGLDPAGRAVAVKVLRPHVAADAVARRRLGREVDTLRRVRHPHVAEVIDCDLDGPVPYLVTAFVPARTLHQQVADHGPPPVTYAAQLGRQLIGALRSIHAAGVVHRDVKPANVLLLDDAPVLIDFGIAHLVDESRITSTGLIMGTPGYLSPEVIDGQHITPATDWWGWGATMAFAVTGRPPFGTGPATVVIDRVRRGEADLQGIDGRLARVLAMALNVNPLWRGTPEMLLSGLAEIEPWRPGGRPLSPALSPDQVRTAPIVSARTEVTEPLGSPSPAPGGRGLTTPLPAPVRSPMPALTPMPVLTPIPVPGPSALAPGPRVEQGPPRRVETAVLPETHSPPVVGGGPRVLPATPRSPGALLALALAALAATAAVAPGLVLVGSLLWALFARVTDRTVTAQLHRRHESGGSPSSHERSAAALALPWRTVSAVPRTVFAALLPVTMAVSTAFVAGAAASPGAPRPGAAPSLVAGTLVGWFTAWWGPGGAAMRRGSRAAARAVGRRRVLHRTVVITLSLLLVAALVTAAGGSSPDWKPVDRAAQGLAEGVSRRVSSGLEAAGQWVPELPGMPQVPEVNLPELPQITLPEITLPEITLPDITLPDVALSLR